MALLGTLVTDMIDPVIFASYIQEESSKVNRIVTSGAVVADPVMQDKINMADGAAFHLPSLTSVSDSTASYAQSSDDPTVIATPDKITGRQQIVAVANRNFSWGGSDLSASFAGTDPMRSAANQAGLKQVIERQKLLVKVLAGVTGSASMSSNVNNISIITGAVTSANQISYGAITDTAIGAWGDKMATGGYLVLHSVIYGRLIKQNVINFTPNSTQDMGFGSYAGWNVLVDDTVPVSADTDPVYTCFLLKPGAVGFAAGQPKVPVEAYRRPDLGNGGGFEFLFIRDKFTFHPYGISFTGSPAVASGVADSELALSTNWSLLFPHKQVGIAALKVNA